MNQLAVELNKTLEGTAAEQLLSDLGRRIYFPKGIIAQSAEAKKSAHRANATIGMACSGGKPLRLRVFAEQFPSFTENESVAYAPTAGVEKLRYLWQEQILRKNPALAEADISLPVIVPGLTAGISYTADLFLDAGQTILAGVPCWDNYSLIFEERRGAALKGIHFVNEGDTSVNAGGTSSGCIDLAAIEKAVNEEAAGGLVRLIINFPNNPTGYSPGVDEAAAISSILERAAKNGVKILVLCDDAYFGLFYEEATFKESLFGKLANLHRNILAVKIDGPTKEDYVWGLRLAAVTFGCKGMNEACYEALIKKMMGLVRSSVSCANTPSQYAFIKAHDNAGIEDEKRAYFEMLKERYLLVKKFIAQNKAPAFLKPLPFNSGYFMSFKTIGVSAEAIRRALLAEYGIGAIALGADYLRVAFASLETSQIEEVYGKLYALTPL
ncbi:MAG: aminotransferase class I/II-fold pyridoxal phosphate-dependent enzyme [Spirochaetaceae bacterium]|jgi:aspartate/methionine/tyrosine aminotransferase|nr:aminotransferase class I/II-fold pyridoxal phosphate-dependent enzyme [Spirochaetaceae bacterium]